jgi:hypothetical protein
MVLHKEQYLVLRDKGEVVITAYMASTKTTSGTDFYKDRYNEAYKPVSKAINILSGDDNKDDSGSGINEIHFGSHIDVYDLRGNKVRSNTTDLNGLQKGIYIVGGKKVVR